jgi:hypothetical protein
MDNEENRLMLRLTMVVSEYITAYVKDAAEWLKRFTLEGSKTT